MLQRETAIDLLTATASAPTRTHRGAAQALLARELAARRDCSAQDTRPRPYNPGDFSYSDMLEVDATTSLAALLASVRLRGGDSAARLYFNYGQDTGPQWSSSTPRQPAADTVYVAALAEVTAIAPLLRAAVLATMDSGSWTTARQPWVDAYARRDFAADTLNVARYRVSGTAAPGERFSLESKVGRSSRFSELDEAATPEIRATAPGAAPFHLQGNARSDSSSAAASISIALVDDATTRSTVSAVRAAPDRRSGLRSGRPRCSRPPTARRSPSTAR